MTAHELRELPERFPVAEPEAEAEPVQEPTEPKVVKGSVSGKLVDPDDIRKLEPLARDLMRSRRRRSGSRRGRWSSPRTCKWRLP